MADDRVHDQQLAGVVEPVDQPVRLPDGKVEFVDGNQHVTDCKDKDAGNALNAGMVGATGCRHADGTNDRRVNGHGQVQLRGQRRHNEYNRRHPQQDNSGCRQPRQLKPSPKYAERRGGGGGKGSPGGLVAKATENIFPPFFFFFSFFLFEPEVDEPRYEEAA